MINKERSEAWKAMYECYVAYGKKEKICIYILFAFYIVMSIGILIIYSPWNALINTLSFSTLSFMIFAYGLCFETLLKTRRENKILLEKQSNIEKHELI